MIAHIVDRFIEYLRSVKGVSEHTSRNYQSDIYCFIETLHIKSFEKVDRKMVREFIFSQHALKLSKRTIARKLSALRTFFRFCMREKYSTFNPMEGVDSPKLDRPIPRSLTYSQIEHFFSLPDTTNVLGFRDRTIMELFYSSGLRLAELVALNRQDVDLEELLIKVLGKGDKERVVPITEGVAVWMRKYLDHPERKEGGAVFLNKFGNRITSRSVDRLFCGYYKRSGFFGKITPHMIRHTIATHWLENGMDIKTIQMLLGHSSMATTTIYTEVSSTLKKEAIDTYHPRN